MQPQTQIVDQIPMYSKLEQQVAFEEGQRLHTYICPAGHKTIGIGHNLDAKPYVNGWKIPDTITLGQCSVIFHQDVQDIRDELSIHIPFMNALDPARRDAILQMGFQLGLGGVLAFHDMLAAVKVKDWQKAHDAALDSKWAKQTPERAKRVAGQLLSGVYYDVEV